MSEVVGDGRDRRRLLAAAAATTAATAVGTLPSGAFADTPSPEAAQEAKAPPLPAPGSMLTLPARIELLDGRTFESATAGGRVLLLYWWASWCPFCALTSPHVDQLWQAQRALGARGLMMLTISIDKRAEAAREYLKKRGYAWPAAWLSPALARALPKSKGLPVTIVRGRDGRVLQAEGGQLFPEDVQALARHVG